MPHSHHSHSGQFCRHAKDDLESMVKRAIELGFTTYGLTEHAPRYRTSDLYPEENDLTPDDLATTFQDFLKEATRLKQVYTDQISLLIGMETENISEIDLSGAEDLIKDERIDYIVGSVHHVGGIPIDFDDPTWRRAVIQCHTLASSGRGSIEDSARSASVKDLEPFLVAYFDAQYEMLQRLQPEVIGHFDLCLLYTPDVRLSVAGDEVWGRVKRNVAYAASYGGLFEANSAALRKGWKTSYPSPEVLELIMSTPGGRICLSDDAHSVAQVGLNYDRMRANLRDGGVQEIFHLANSARPAGGRKVGSRDRVVAIPSSDWEEDRFWSAFHTS